MLTKLENEILRFCASITSITQSCPFSWERQNGFKYLSTNVRIWQKWLGALNLFLGVVHLIYLVIRLVIVIGASNFQEYKFLNFYTIIHVFTAHCFNICVIMQAGAFWSSNELAALINQLLRFNIEVKDKSARCRKEAYAPPNLREKIISGFGMYVGVFCIVIMPGINIILPYSQHTLYSSLPSTWQNPCTLVLTLGFEFLSWTRAFVFEWFTFYIGYVYIITNSYWLGRLRKDLRSCSFKDERFQIRPWIIYQGLTIMNRLYNIGFASIIFPALKLGLEVGLILSFYSALRFHNSVNIFIYIFLISVGVFLIVQLSATILFMAGLYEKSLQFKYELKDALSRMPLRPLTGGKGKAKLLLKQSILATRPMYCRVGSLFFVEKSTKIDYVALLVNAFLQVLLTTTRT